MLRLLSPSNKKGSRLDERRRPSARGYLANLIVSRILEQLCFFSFLSIQLLDVGDVVTA